MNIFENKVNKQTIPDDLDTIVHFTIDGSEPVPSAQLGLSHSTKIYTSPFSLPPGKQIVKAVAVARYVWEL